MTVGQHPRSPSVRPRFGSWSEHGASGDSRDGIAPCLIYTYSRGRDDVGVEVLFVESLRFSRPPSGKTLLFATDLPQHVRPAQQRVQSRFESEFAM